MAKSAIADEIKRKVDDLTPAQQEEVLAFVRSLEDTEVQGISGRDFVAIAKTITISDQDLQLIADAIDNDCEQVDAREW
jgi:hypothetical protein